MRIDVMKEKPGFVRFTPHGPIDSDTCLEFQEKIKPLSAPPVKNVLFDLNDVGYLSSAGLGVFFQLKKELLARGGDVFFCNLKPAIQKLFDIVKALPKETVFESYEEADRYFYRIIAEELEREKKKK